MNQRKLYYEHEVDSILTILRGMLDSEVPAITVSSKIPFKAASVIQVLLYRAVELGTDAKFLYEHKRMMSSFILSRAVFETGAIMLWSVMSMERYLCIGKIDNLDDTLMLALHGSRLEGATLSAKNIITILQQLDKRHPSSNGGRYQRIYSWFSEYAHPNSASTFNQYATIDRTHVRLVLRGGYGKLPDQLPIHALYMALGNVLDAFHEYIKTMNLFLLSFDSMQDIMTIVAKYHSDYEIKESDTEKKLKYELIKHAPEMMARAIERFGNRDPRYHINDIRFEYFPDKKHPYTMEDPSDNMGRIIYLGVDFINSTFPNGNPDWMQRLAHELVHCLAPSEKYKVLEEGCACMLGYEFSKHILQDGWLAAHNLLDHLENLHKNIIKDIRSNKTSNFTDGEYFGISDIQAIDFGLTDKKFTQGVNYEVCIDLCVDFIPQNFYDNTLFPNNSINKIQRNIS